MTLFADLLSTLFERRYRTPRVAKPDDRPIEEMTAELMGSAGEISGIALAKQILDCYAVMDDDKKKSFFRHVAEDMKIVATEVRDALEAYERGQTKASYRALMAASEPPRQKLVRRLNQVPGATHALVQMRADLLRLGQGDDALQAMDLDFRHLFVSWFNRGFLVLRPINWESPAHILEKIIAYEAVHAIDSWDDLRRRLQPTDRRCFAFFHPAMPDEPLIFVEVALTHGVPGSIHKLLAEDRRVLDGEEANTAVFYSISNCQTGLASISFGNLLIKQVVADLTAEMPELTTFVTLSPVPRLKRWLEEKNLAADLANAETLRQLTARYLLKAKRPDGLPFDPVARFHLGNGATIHQVHAGADTSANGLSQSAGAMVNYLYDLSRVPQNHERFATNGEIAASVEIQRLATAGEKTHE